MRFERTYALGEGRSSRREQRGVALLFAVALLSSCATFGQPSIEDLLREGTRLYDAGHYSESASKFEEVLHRDPQRWIAWLYLGRSFLAMNDWGQAIDAGRKAFELAPSDGEVAGFLGKALLGGGVDALKSGRFGEAIGMLRDYVKLQPGDVGGWLKLADAFVGSGDYAGAAGAFLDGLGQASGSGAHSDLMAAMLRTGKDALADGRAQDAVALLQAYVSEDPSNVSALLDLGKAHWSSGDRGDALAAFAKVLKLSPTNAEALRFMMSGR